MLIDLGVVQQKVSEVTLTRSSDEYLKLGTQQVADWLKANPEHWKSFGPYWGVVQDILGRFTDASVDTWNDGEPAPDYLALYNYGDDLLNWVGAMLYLHQDGDYLKGVDQPHSIVMPDGRRALYSPGVGILEE